MRPNNGTDSGSKHKTITPRFMKRGSSLFRTNNFNTKEEITNIKLNMINGNNLRMFKLSMKTNTRSANKVAELTNNIIFKSLTT